LAAIEAKGVEALLEAPGHDHSIAVIALL